MRRQVIIKFEDDYIWAYPVDKKDYYEYEGGKMFDEYYPVGILSDDKWVGILESVWQSDDLYPPLAVQNKDILSIEIVEL